MTQEHPITPSLELVEQWLENTRSHDCIGAYPANYEQLICTQAARWGADTELEACCEWLETGPYGFSIEATAPSMTKQLRAARRPNPPSLKEQALDELNFSFSRGYLKKEAVDAIRRALEALPND
jgi:hypothetical protein